MVQVEWNLFLSSGPVNIILDHGTILGRRRVTLNGKTVIQTGMHIVDNGSDHEFRLKKHVCKIIICVLPFGYSYKLTVDGKDPESLWWKRQEETNKKLYLWRKNENLLRPDLHEGRNINSLEANN